VEPGCESIDGKFCIVGMQRFSVTEEEEKNIWDTYISNPTQENKKVLVASYDGYVNAIAANLFANRQVIDIQFNEYKQYGLVGLLEALERFNPAQGVRFKSYATHRIRGAILSGIEKHSEQQQQISHLARLRQERMQSLVNTQAKAVKRDAFLELAEVAFGLAIGIMLEGTTVFDPEVVQVQSDVYKKRELSDLSKLIARLIELLPKQEQQVLQLHYYQKQGFDEISRSLAITRGRVSQIHKRAILGLQQYYDELKLHRIDY
jgi:RNA polymerase sigma factor FliA